MEDTADLDTLAVTVPDGSAAVDGEVLSEDERARRVRMLEERLAEKSLGGHWQRRRRPPALEPFVWQWEDIYSCLTEAGEVVRLGADTLRRTVQLVNPSLSGDSERRGTSRTIQMSVQLVKPGERAQCHRHTAQALRFVVQGCGAYTTVEGERLLMEPNDLLLTPGWTWHDHANLTSEPVVWLDGLDVPLASWLDAQFQVDYPTAAQPVTKVDGASAISCGPIRSTSPSANPWAFPPYRYRWSDTRQALEQLASAPAGEGDDPCDGVLMEYANPLGGGHTLPTISCRIQMLRPGWAGDGHRHTATTIYHVVEGRGRLVVDGRTLEWGPRDCFVVPSWRAHQLSNASADEPSILFSMTDSPVLEALGLLRVQSGSTGPEIGEVDSP